MNTDRDATLIGGIDESEEDTEWRKHAVSTTGAVESPLSGSEFSAVFDDIITSVEVFPATSRGVPISVTTKGEGALGEARINIVPTLTPAQAEALAEGLIGAAADARDLDTGAGEAEEAARDGS